MPLSTTSTPGSPAAYRSPQLARLAAGAQLWSSWAAGWGRRVRAPPLSGSITATGRRCFTQTS